MTELLCKIWKRLILSVWSVLIVAAALVASSFFWVQKGSVVDHPIRDIHNRDVEAETKVKASNINLSNPVYIYMRCKPHITRDHSLALIQFVDRAEKFFAARGLGGKVAISSLASVIDYNSDDLENFISKKRLADPEFNARDWAEKTLSRVDVDGGLAGRVPGEYEYFLVTFFPEQDFSELEMYRLVRAFLKGKDLSIWELYMNPDLKIDPSFFEANGQKVDMTIEPMGWSEGRGEIDVQSNAETWVKVFGGIIFLSGALLFALLRPGQALCSMAIITLAFLVNRSLIGVCDQVSVWLGSPYRYLEDVFSILNSPASLIAGFSYPLRSFYKFNIEVKENTRFFGDVVTMDDAVYWRCWKSTFSKVFFPITLVTVLAVQDYINYMGWQQLHGSRSMWQVAIFSATGLTISYFLTVVFLPPFYRLIGGRNVKQTEMHFAGWKILSYISGKVDGGIGAISNFFLRRAVCGSLIVPVAVFVSVILLAAILLGRGMLITDSKPQELLYSVPMGQTAKELSKPGRIGFNVSEAYIKNDLTDPEVLDRIWNYSQEMKKAGRTVFGPMNFFVSVLLRDVPEYRVGGSIKQAVENFVAADLENPTRAEIERASRDFVGDVWNDILDQKSTAPLMSHFLTRDLSQMLEEFSFSGEKATQMAAFVDLEYSNAKKFGLDVLVPTKLAQYTQVDRMIASGPFNTDPPWGILLNDGLSQVTIVLLVFLVFCYQRKRSDDHAIRPWLAGCLVAVPFIFSSAIGLLAMMLYHIPYDVASASIRSITVSVAVDLPIFLILGFQRLISERKESFGDIMLGRGMRHEADEVFVDFLVNSMAFVLLIWSGFPTIHRLGLMLVLAMAMFVIGTLWMVMPFMRYLIRPVSVPVCTVVDVTSAPETELLE